MNWVLTCEHGGYALPRAYGTLGLSRADLRDHIGWDPGAAAVSRELAKRLSAPVVASKYSRLLIDCNRDPGEASLIPEASDGRVVPGNLGVTAAERRRRLERFHAPYHARVDRMLERACRRFGSEGLVLLSMHSFTPSLDGRERPFDLGVLFDDHRALAHQAGRALRRVGFAVRYNEPYSGLDGLIYAARRHGRAHGVPYIELEMNNARIGTPSSQLRMARSLARALRSLG